MRIFTALMIGALAAPPGFANAASTACDGQNKDTAYEKAKSMVVPSLQSPDSAFLPKVTDPEVKISVAPSNPCAFVVMSYFEDTPAGGVKTRQYYTITLIFEQLIKTWMPISKFVEVSSDKTKVESQAVLALAALEQMAIK